MAQLQAQHAQVLSQNIFCMDISSNGHNHKFFPPSQGGGEVEENAVSSKSCFTLVPG